jgi:hypothetical protein
LPFKITQNGGTTGTDGRRYAYKFFDEKYSSVRSFYIKEDTDVVYDLSKTLGPKTPKILLTPNSVDKNFTILLYSSILIALFFVMICISETGVLLISIAPLQTDADVLSYSISGSNRGSFAYHYKNNSLTHVGGTTGLFFVMICISETGGLLISIAPLNCSNRSCREYSSVIIVDAPMKQISIKLVEGESDWYAQHDALSYAGLMDTLSRQTDADVLSLHCPFELR